VLAHPAFAAGELDTGFIARHQAQLLPTPQPPDDGFWVLAADAWLQGQATHYAAQDPHSPWAARDGWRCGLASDALVHLVCEGERRPVRASGTARLEGDWLTCEQDGILQRWRAIRQGDSLYLGRHGDWRRVQAFNPLANASRTQAGQSGLSAPMNGSIVRVLVSPGQQVEPGTPLLVLEAMKMEHSIRAPHAGRVTGIRCAEGDLVAEGSVLVDLEAV
jgi:3-methylcrotonyl-CoA carboxylase alpha subunit